MAAVPTSQKATLGTRSRALGVTITAVAAENSGKVQGPEKYHFGWLGEKIREKTGKNRWGLPSRELTISRIYTRAMFFVTGTKKNRFYATGGYMEKRSKGRRGRTRKEAAGTLGTPRLKDIIHSNVWQFRIVGPARNAIKIINYGSGKERFSLPARRRAFLRICSFLLMCQPVKYMGQD